MNYPKISIITPSYNQGQFLERTLRSVIDQNYPNLEYIIVDGGSTDNSLEIIQKYKAKITCLAEPDEGQSDAINKGIKLASGEIVSWLNSDDMLAEGTLDFVARRFSESPEPMFLYGPIVFVDENDKSLYLTRLCPLSFKTILYTGYVIDQVGTFWKRELYRRVGGLNELLGLAMDWDLWLRMSKEVDFEYVHRVMGYARVHKQAKTYSMGRKKYLFQLLKCRQGYLDEFGIKPSVVIRETVSEFIRARCRGLKTNRDNKLISNIKYDTYRPKFITFLVVIIYSFLGAFKKR